MKCAATILCVLFPFAAAFAQSASATLRPLPLDCKATGQPSFVVKSQNQLPRVGALFFGPMLSGAAIDEKALGRFNPPSRMWIAPEALKVDGWKAPSFEQEARKAGRRSKH